MTTLDPTGADRAGVAPTERARPVALSAAAATTAAPAPATDAIAGEHRIGTGTGATRVIGVATIVAMAWLVAFGLGFSPADRDQDDAVRILYVHVPTIWIAYLAFVVTAIASAMYLFRKQHSLGWDRLAGASAEIGVVFVAVTLVVGALWGRLTWGVFWQWDARLTTTALLFVTYVGYLAVRRLGGSHEQRARRSAVLGLLAVLEIPLVHWSVRLWRSLHQEATVLSTDGDIDMDGLMLFSLFVGVIAFTLLYLWLVLHRTRAMAMEDVLDDRALDLALEARRAEAPDAGRTDRAGEAARDEAARDEAGGG
jgi:heme exporter protein C